MESMEKEITDLIEKRLAERKAVEDKKVLKLRWFALIMELGISTLGYGLILYHTNIWVLLGIWFAIWGNNMGMTRSIYKERENIWREIWKDQN